mgnify:CR=1 FL=1
MLVGCARRGGGKECSPQELDQRLSESQPYWRYTMDSLVRFGDQVSLCLTSWRALCGNHFASALVQGLRTLLISCGDKDPAWWDHPTSGMFSRFAALGAAFHCCTGALQDGA